MEGVPNEDLPNYWQCPLCVKLGRGWNQKSRVPKGLLFLRALETAAMEAGAGDGELARAAVVRLMSGRPRGSVGRPKKRAADGEMAAETAKRRGRPKKVKCLIL